MRPRSLACDVLNCTLDELSAHGVNAKGMETESYQERVRALEAGGASPKDIEELRRTYAISGRTGLIEKDLKSDLRAWEKDHWHVTAFFVAERYRDLGNTEEAFAWLNKCIDMHSTMLPWIYAYPTGPPLHSDPRFAEIRRKMGIAN